MYILETGGRQFLVETQFGLQVIFSLLLFHQFPDDDMLPYQEKLP